MRKIYLFFVAASFAACNNSSETKVEGMSTAGDSSTKEEIAYPYTAMYSSKFEMGDAKNSKMLLDLWKAWDNGDINKMKEMMADTIQLQFANGMTERSSRDSAMAHAQAFRSTLDSVASRVDAFFPVKSTDKDENWVCIWGMETDKDKKGKIDSVNLQETWRINKDGKFDYLLQYNRPFKARKM